MKFKTFKNTTILFSIFLLSSCSKDTYSPPEGNTIPEGAEVIEYDNFPGLVHVILRNGEMIAAEGDFFNGLESGAYTEYNDKGVVTSIINYYKGAQQGLTFVFKSNELQSKANYHDGVLHGEYKQYNRRKLIEEKTYENGKLQGVARKFYTNGNIMEEAFYNVGQLDGIAKWFNQEGEMTIAYKYDKGELIDKNPALK
ncbi:MAG: antitoxin component YwqK of YwqJK toxin-antitoxin module [Cyclobacteriaceae bacterium]|jgi:antitoxin component YwqK of YwqJK toxin-antitoxin module